MGARILIADDSVTIQKVVELTFSREDFVLIPARSGEEAIRKAKEARPDLMLIDLVMPDKNGYDVCRALREDPQLKTTPIILLTGTFENFDRDEGLRVGANDFVTKPFESRALITKVKQLLSPTAAPAAREPVRARPAGPAVVAEGVAAEERMPAMAAPPASPVAAPAAAALSPAQGPVFEAHEELFPEVPSAPPALSAAPPEPAPGPAPSELQELSLDDLTAEEPLGGMELPTVEQQRVEPAAGPGPGSAGAPGLAEARGPAAEPPSRQMAPASAAPAFDLELGSSYPEAGPSMAEALPAAPALPELDLDLVSARAPAAPVYELEPLDLEAPPPPAVVGTEDLLRELESAGALRAAEPEKPLAAPAAAPAAPPEIERPPTVVSSAVERGMPRPPGPIAATAPSADALAARLAAQLGPQLAREIADRIVERIERVVWEVVPDLAEALIARELDRIKERAERRPAR